MVNELPHTGRDEGRTSTPVEKLITAIRLTQDAFRNAPGHAGIIDVALIGNTSGAYPWEPSYTIDVDIAIFADALDEPLGRWLLAAGQGVCDALQSAGIGFALKVVRGGYKPVVPRLIRPVVVAHLGVFTEASYAERPVTLRWGWRKYRCLVEPGRLARYAPSSPNWDDLRELVRRKLGRVAGGTVRMTEWTLPAFAESVLEFDDRDPMFAEYCFSTANVCARTHARILGRDEADRLSNRDFAPWYCSAVLESPAFEGLMSLKQHARSLGYEGLNPGARAFVLDYLGDLNEHLDSLPGSGGERAG